MREISPAQNASVDEYLTICPWLKPMVAGIRYQKEAASRPCPSATLIDSSAMLTKIHRGRLLDEIAAKVDENLTGRSDMCQQFADLLHLALAHLNFPSRPAVGWAIYFSPNGDEIHRWKHAWVRVGEEAIDGNVDCLFENPRVPKTVQVAPYWGPIKETPRDRRLRQDRSMSLPADEDVSKIWWPELKTWLDEEFCYIR